MKISTDWQLSKPGTFYLPQTKYQIEFDPEARIYCVTWGDMLIAARASLPLAKNEADVHMRELIESGFTP